jgi:pilus assembly protein CpaB
MRPSVIMLAVIAFILAGAAAFLVKVFLEKQSQPVVVQQQEERPQGVAKVLVASRNINPGEILSAKDVTWAEWPKALIEDRMILESELVIPSASVPPTQVGLVVRPEMPVPSGAAGGDAQMASTEDGEPALEEAAASLGEVSGEEEGASRVESANNQNMGVTNVSATADAQNEVVGAVARRRIMANEPVSPDALIRRGDRSIGSAVVSPGMRAISVPISAATGAGGFIAPGDYVDVLLSMAHEIKITGPDGKAQSAEGMAITLPDGDSMVKYTTETVMRNVRVLAIDQRLARDEDAGPADVGKTATLEASPHDAEKLLTAGQLGSLTLVLRSLVIDESVQDEVDAFEDPFNFMSDVATSRAVSALHTTSSLYGFGPGGPVVRVNRGGAISQEGF